MDSAYFGLGLSALRQGRKDDAKQAFRTLINRFRQGMIGYTYLDRE